MKIKSVKINNFMGIGSADVSLNKGGITLIQGSNNDSKTALSNGSGKSSLLESVYWAIYGKTKRGLTADSVINRHDKKAGCHVDVAFQLGENAYSIIRSRKDKELGTGLKLVVERDGKAVDISKGTASDTQEQIEDLIKINPVVFERTAFVGQGDIKPFASLTDRELKATFEEALGLRFFSETFEKVKVKRRTLEENLITTKTNRESTERDIEELKIKNVNIDDKIAGEKRHAIDKQNGIRDEIKRLVEERSIAEKELHEAERTEGIGSTHLAAKYKDEIFKIQSEIDKLVELDEQLSDKLSVRREKMASMRTLEDTVRINMEKNQKSIVDANTKLEKGCPACKRPFDKKALNDYISEIKGQLEKSKGDMSEIADGKSKINKDIEKLNPLRGQLESKISDFRKKISEYEIAIERQNAEKKALIESVERHKRDIEINDKRKAEYEAKLDRVREELESIVHDLEKTKTTNNAEINVLEKSIERYDGDIKAIEKNVNVLSLLEKALGNGGLKSYVFDSVTPILNKEINEMLSILDPAISAEISTLKKLKSGDFREKFDVKITNLNGADSYNGNSGGEKAKVDLAIALAFNHLARDMGGDVGVLFLDEPFEALDDQSSEAVVDLLSSFDAENIFVVSHNPAIQDIVSNRIVVEKTDGFATAKYI